MADCHLHEAGYFTRREAALCFIWSQPFVTDEVKRRMQMTNLSFVDFLEAVARLCTFKPMPTDELLKECRALTVPHFFQQASVGLHAGSGLLGALDWREEERSQASLREPLEKLISLLTDALDCNHDGVVTKTELRKCVPRPHASRMHRPQHPCVRLGPRVA